ncbi:MAG TPA: hypothetical protein VH023_00440 [Rhodopila sp.]|jgi:hypothetical protein|nr:hypothetical protein [Rhodopila sp.]
MPEPILPPARYERSDVPIRVAVIAAPGILVGLLASVLLVWWIYPGSTVDRRLPTPPPRYPEPRLQTDPAADMQAFLATELKRLNSGGWDDKSKAAGHIPIDDAMRRIAASGIPDWPK